MLLNKLTQALEVLECTFGIEACLAAANEVYSGVYKSAETFTLAEVLAEVADPRQAQTIRTEFINDVAEYLAIANGTYLKPTLEELEAEVWVDRSGVEAMQASAETLLDNGIRFVHLCNYKGEDAGSLLEDLAKKLTYLRKQI